jgi:hypothetical protein
MAEIINSPHGQEANESKEGIMVSHSFQEHSPYDLKTLSRYLLLQIPSPSNSAIIKTLNT